MGLWFVVCGLWLTPNHKSQTHLSKIDIKKNAKTPRAPRFAKKNRMFLGGKSRKKTHRLDSNLLGEPADGNAKKD